MAKGIRVDNIIRFKFSRRKFYSMWTHLLLPFHRLSPKLTLVATELIARRFELLGKVKDSDIMSEVLFGDKSAEIISKRANITVKYFRVCVSRLKDAGFIVDGDINKKFMPRMSDPNRFTLLFHFDIEDDEGDERFNDPNNGEADEHDKG